MESKVSEGGLNVTLTIRLLMHGKVKAPGRAAPLSLSFLGFVRVLQHHLFCDVFLFFW